MTRRVSSTLRVEHAIGRLLRAGVLLSAAVMLSGGIWFLATHGGHPAAFSQFAGQPFRWNRLPELIAQLVAGNSEAVLWIGLLLLIGLPVMRVGLSLILFVQERDWIYVVFTLVVLSILLFSLSGGRFF